MLVDKDLRFLIYKKNLVGDDNYHTFYYCFFHISQPIGWTLLEFRFYKIVNAEWGCVIETANIIADKHKHTNTYFFNTNNQFRETGNFYKYIDILIKG